MKNKIFLAILLTTILISGCNSSYNGPYASTPLVTKENVKKQIEIDEKLISNSKTPLLKQVQTKSDLNYFRMLLNCYESYENKIKSVNSKQYTITATDIDKFIKSNNYSPGLKLIEPNNEKWPSIFLGNLARYFASLGFGINTSQTLKEENIVITW